MKTIIRAVCIALIFLGLYPSSILAQEFIYLNNKSLENIKTLLIEGNSDVVLHYSDSINYISFPNKDKFPHSLHYDKEGSRLIISSGEAVLYLSSRIKLECIEVNGTASLKGPSQFSPFFADTVLINLRNTADMTLALEAKAISVSMSEVSDANLKINAQNINILAKSASTIKANLNSENVYIALSSASDAILEGNVDQMKVFLSGLSDLNAPKLKVNTLELYTSGQSVANIKADSLINSSKVDSLINSSKVDNVIYSSKVDNVINSSKMEKKVDKSFDKSFSNFDLNALSRNKFSKNGRKKFRGHWMGIEAGFNYYTRVSDPNIPMDIDYGKSGSFAWNVFQYSIGFNSPHIGFVTGAGFLWNNYRFDDPRTTPHIQDGKFAVKLDEDPTRFYEKSKLTVSYFRIPLLFEYTNAKKYWRNFHVSVGAIAGVRMCTWSKQIYKIQGLSGDEKSKNKSDFYVNPIRFDLVSYIGIGPLNFYFSYAATNLFLKNKGPEVTPFAFGFMLGLN